MDNPREGWEEVLPEAFLEHLECGYQPHAQDRGAQKRTQLAGRSVSGYGLESPSPGGAQSQGHNTGLRGLAPCTGFPLNCRTPPLYSELVDTDTTPSDTRIRTAPTQLPDFNTIFFYRRARRSATSQS